MKITDDVRKYAAEQAISEDALEKGMEKAKEFVEKGGGLREGVNLVTELRTPNEPRRLQY